MGMGALKLQDWLLCGGVKREIKYQIRFRLEGHLAILKFTYVMEINCVVLESLVK